VWEHKVGNRIMKSRALPLTYCHTDDVCTAVKEIASINADEFCKCRAAADSQKDGHGVGLSGPSEPIRSNSRGGGHGCRNSTSS